MVSHFHKKYGKKKTFLSSSLLSEFSCYLFFHYLFHYLFDVVEDWHWHFFHNFISLFSVNRSNDLDWLWYSLIFTPSLSLSFSQSHTHTRPLPQPHPHSLNSPFFLPSLFHFPSLTLSSSLSLPLPHTHQLFLFSTSLLLLSYSPNLLI